MFGRLVVFILLIPGSLLSQDILFTVDGNGTTVDEFLYTFQKNQQAFTREDVEEYLELYVNFKLKVREARSLGMDTLPTYKSELESFKRQLVQPYLTEKGVTEALVEEAFQRQQEEIAASHILLRLPTNPTPEDTAVVYSRAMNIYNQATPANFPSLATRFSEEPGAVTTKGYLGYFTALQMVYPFETIAYNTPVGEISKPFRTRFGYHIVHVSDRRPSRGKVEISHIMIRFQRDMTAADTAAIEEKIWEVHQLAMENYNWEHLVESYSDDLNTKGKGGVLPAFGVGEMLPAILDVAFSLDTIGQVSDPVLTDFGWHLLRLENTVEPKPFEQVKSDLERKINRDSRSEKGEEVLLERLKHENGYREFALCDSLRRISNVPSENTIDSLKGIERAILQVGDDTQTLRDFAEFIATRNDQKPVHVMLDAFIGHVIKNEEIDRLPQKYPEYGYLLKEYREGILLFDIMTQQIWEPAEQDSVAIAQYFREHLAAYRTPERATLSIFEGSFTDSVKFRAAVDGYLADSSYYQKREQQLASAFGLKVVESGTFTNETSAYVGEVGLKFSGGKAIVIWANTEARIPELQEIKGRVIADFQEYKEMLWVEDLRTKYEVKINKRNLKKIYKQFEI